ncbi:DUF3048 domain-containing protein [Candidatus Saccharibacteria bacterium]|nr:DUF3048 domain-containing protein [Candidatus Saccharibacteria bacterium]MCL1962741.1 DUF3048 domain-containing protein [Candidatus Saccharibacteria bacterium]
MKKVTWSGKDKQKRGRRVKTASVVMVVTILIGIASLSAWIFLRRDPAKNDKSGDKNTTVEQKFYSPLTGRRVANEEITRRPVVAVMIENSFDARPQSGLVDAGVVFEAIAEGGITRFVALYQESEPEFIGPIRSARPYYLDWVAAFDPAIIHVGGSEEALDMLRGNWYGLNIDEIDDSVIFRVNDRYAPHDAYTNFKKYSAYLNKKNKTSSDFVGWARQDGKARNDVDELSAKSIDVGISVGGFVVHYDYDVATNSYKRSVGGEPHNDREKGRISPDVVIALRSTYGLLEDGLHSKYQTIGENEVYIFQNGNVIKGTWQKDGVKSQIKFFDESGTEIKLNRGQVWITAIGQNESISWK